MTGSFTHLFEAIDHLGIAVADLDDAIAFYRDVLGFEVRVDAPLPQLGSRR